MRTCKACGCYIPDLWSECPACGRVNLGNDATTTLRRQDGKAEDLELLDEPDAEIVWSSDPNVKPYPIELEPYWPWSEIKLHQGTNK